MSKRETGRVFAVLLALGLVFLTGGSALARSSGSETQPSSAAPQLRFERITTAEGLSFPVVRDILQDRQGFIWFATDSGLNRYDGYGFTVYKEDPGDPTTIRFDGVSTLFEDSDGTLWVGGGGGLDRFNRTNETFTHVDTRGQVYDIQEDSAGTLWVGFWHGLYGYDRATNQIVHDEQPNPSAPGEWSARTESAVQEIYEDRDGYLWIGAAAGLYRLDRASGLFTAYRHDPGVPTSLSSGAITALYEDRLGNFWVGTQDGFGRLDRSTGDFYHYRHDPENPDSLSHDRVLSILEAGSGRLWLATMGGLELLDPGQDRFYHYRHDPEDDSSLSGTIIISLLEDRTGVLWVGAGTGVNKSGRREDPFTRFRHAGETPAERTYSLDLSGLLDDSQPAILSDARILAVEEDREGVLWLGTFDGGLNRLDRGSGQLTVYRHDPADPGSLSSNRVGAVLEDHAGVLWVGTVDGVLEQFDPQTEAFVHLRRLGANVTAMAEDSTGNLWIGTGGEGLYRLDGDRLTLAHYQQYWQVPDNWWRSGSLSSHVVSTLEVDQGDLLWAGTVYGGINLWGEWGDRFTYLRHDPGKPNSLSHDQVLAILEDPEAGVVWIGTGGGGLNRFDRETRTVVHYAEEDGLPGDTVGCILADDAGFLWLATVRGLSRFDPVAGTFRNYDRRDGVGVLTYGTGGPGCCLRSRSGEMIFGGGDGLYVFRPEQIHENLLPPPMAITAVKIAGETVYRTLLGDEWIRLSYRDNFLSFEFSALDYTMPERNQYAYRLEGLDRDWVYAGSRRFADYPDLKPGDYTFRVKGANSDGVWNEEGAAVRVTVEPPIWATWPFRVMMALAVVLGAVGLYRQRVRNVEARSRELETQVEERTQEIRRLSEKARELAVMEERQRLARDLHDAVSQTLFSASLIAEALPEMWQADPEEGRDLLVKLKQLSRGAQAEMRSLLMELRPAALTEASMRDLLRQLGQALSGREGIPVTVTLDEACESPDHPLPAEVQNALYRIAQEALNNVLKHARATDVQVSLRCSPSAAVEEGAPVPGTETEPVGVELIIRDDGLGFDPNRTSHDRLGLGIMHERAAAIGASLEIESEPGGGTQVRVLWASDKGGLHG